MGWRETDNVSIVNDKLAEHTCFQGLFHYFGTYGSFISQSLFVFHILIAICFFF